MPRKTNTGPKRSNKPLTSSCTCMQEPVQLVRLYLRSSPADIRSYSSEDQTADYSSPVCYAHLREFREGF
ncbi:hypothetical protein K3G39_13400 [Pontibacter sp. HSC-14F20]|uniref:hypothetical protein n=1 Tax=Pontibacter sp. HSC-14F20 TaxID=2864136 RepID=UPI001C7300BA|nr:hypothetical protein [Pontibacter sp. HSC-14F20]MBX0334233.1 hypothetical protein [Pontibacter sp. HSC-14F20]